MPTWFTIWKYFITLIVKGLLKSLRSFSCCKIPDPKMGIAIIIPRTIDSTRDTAIIRINVEIFSKKDLSFKYGKNSIIIKLSGLSAVKL